MLEFIGTDVNGKDVLELGAGIGRMSEKLVLEARHLTCLDLSNTMLSHNRSRLGNLSHKVRYLHMFGQDYRPKTPHDVVISSLVLIHNVDHDSFQRIVEVMKASAKTIFLFEHIDVGHQVSRHTRLRSEKELLSAFSEYKLEKRLEYQLFTDNVIFLKLVLT